MTSILITGANKGLGFETARRLVAAGHTVCLGSRDAGRGRQAAAELGALAVRLDVTDDASVAAAAAAVEAHGGLDVLVNNAGIQEEMGAGGVTGAAEVTAGMARTDPPAAISTPRARCPGSAAVARPARCGLSGAARFPAPAATASPGCAPRTAR